MIVAHGMAPIRPASWFYLAISRRLQPTGCLHNNPTRYQAEI
jgi:hypothetical protein